MSSTSAPPSAPPARLLSSATWEPTVDVAVAVTVDSEQLHGRACIHCGSALDGLVDAGHAYTAAADGGRLGWPVKACVHHSGAGAAA
jgi:hypothetical protein